MDVINKSWWKTTLDDVDSLLSSVKRGKTSVLCKSAGGRDVNMVVYGEKSDFKRRANYNSACGAGDPRYYADKTDSPPVIVLVGAIHAQELEGTAALMNLIHLLENKRDLVGSDGGTLGEALAEAEDFRLIIIPIMNPDGRARCLPNAMIGLTPDELRHWGQGRWLNGELCGWPGCKAVHPIKEATSFLGAYFNDDGINMMHDNFFDPMSTETSALLKLVENEAPDYTILLHGGSNCTNVLLQPAYTPRYIRGAVRSLALRIARLTENAGLPSSVREIANEPSFPPPSFNLTSALHHVCGGVCVTYESNQGLADKNSFTAEEILLHHYMLFEGLIREANEALKR